jgi:hypothetical protein
MEHPAYFREMTAAEFYLFPRIISALKGWCFCDANDVIRNATEELKRLSQNGFQQCFLHIYSRWQKHIYAQGDCFEENVA